MSTSYYKEEKLSDAKFIKSAQEHGNQWPQYMKEEIKCNIPVLRGNSWHNAQYYCRCSFRNLYPPLRRWSSVGFRCVRNKD